MHLIRLLLILCLPASLLAGELPGPPSEEMLLQAAANVRLGYPATARALLQAVVIPEDRPQWTLAQRLLLARADLLEGKGKSAIELLTPLVDSKRIGIARLARKHLAHALLLDGQAKAALAQVDRLWKVANDGAHGPELCRLGFDAAQASGEKKLMEAWHKRLKRCGGIDGSEVMAAAIAVAAAGKTPPTELCNEFIRDYPCADVPSACGTVDLVAGLTPGQRIERARKLFDCWGYEAAAAEFEVCLKEPGFKRYVDRCHFYLGEIHARKLRDDRDKAFRHFEHVYEHGGGDRDYALYQMARCQMNLEHYDEAARLFRQYIDRFPNGAHVERCYYYLGWLPYDHDELEAALPGFDTYLDKYGKADLRTYILWFKAWSLYRLGRYADATRPLDRLAGYGNDIVAGKAYYWLGRIGEARNDSKAARAWFEKALERYPLSYYGVLSWRRLKTLGHQAEHPLFTVPYQAVERPLPSALSRYVEKDVAKSLQPAMDAVLVGEMRAARAWFKPVQDDFDRQAGKRHAGAQRWRMEVLEEPSTMRSWGRKHHRARGLVPTNKGRSGWTFEYPRAYLRLIEVQAAQTGLPKWFFFSIMRQESRYRRGVISWADAVGLVQVIPPTGQKTAARLGIPFDRFNLSDPAVNLRLGTSYLGFLARDFHHQLTLVAASYNAGPDPIRTFVKDNGSQGWDFLIEEIAYNEARNYCRKVTGHVLKYLATYAPLEERRAVFELLFPDPPRLDIGDDVDY